MSRVVCLVFPGLGAADAAREGGPALALRVRAFLARNCDGEGNGGRSARSNVSIVSNDVGSKCE
jgi:hypothetical protein